MTRFNLRLLIALFVTSALFLASCTESDDPVSGDEDPFISSVSHAVAPVGTVITINGSNFGSAGTDGGVFFNDYQVQGEVGPGNPYRSWSDTRIEVVVPAQAISGYIQIQREGNLSNRVDFYVGPLNPEPPANAAAASRDEQSVILSWDPAPADAENWSAFQDYVVYITPDAGGDMDPVITEETSMVVDGLQDGEIYSFEIKARYTSSEESINGAIIEWSPAGRYEFTGNGVTIKLYESNSSLGSGLDLFYPDDNAPAIWPVDDGDLWNLGIYTRNQGELQFGSAGLISYNFIGTPNSAEISTTYWDADDIDNTLETQALDTYDYDEILIDLLDAGLQQSSKVFYVRVTEPGESDYNYAKVLVKYQNGSFLQGTSPNRYIECVVSYQSAPGVPYAKTPQFN